MSFNFSSNASLLPPPPPSLNSSLYPSLFLCYNFRSTFFIVTAFSITNILLLLPLCSIVLYLGLQRWQKQRSASSHSDVFTYHMVAVEMIGIFGCGFYCCGACFNVPSLLRLGLKVIGVGSPAQLLFHTLTCVERYLAVVHPIIYLSLRNRDGVRIRNISIGCCWLIMLVSMCLSRVVKDFQLVESFCLLVFTLLVVTFCTLSVLHALIRPGPGEGSREGEWVNQSKMRAFYIITAITGALLIRFGGSMLALSIFFSPAVSERVRCGTLISGIWFCLPGSMVSPLLFLHRAGKLLCCMSNNESDTDQSGEC